MRNGEAACAVGICGVRMKRADFATLAALGMAAGLIGLGALSVAARGFAFQWEPVPKAFPAREALGLLSGLVALAAGGLLVVPRTRAWGALVAALFLGV